VPAFFPNLVVTISNQHISAPESVVLPMPETQMSIVPAELWPRLEQGELESLIACDRRGLLIGANETAAQFVARLQCLQANIAELETALASDGSYRLENLLLASTARIGHELFAEVENDTRSLYDFAVDWVPGFFVDPGFGWLFGGAAFYFYPDFFALFIIRRSFRNKPKWLIYRRSELLAHELCHIARIALESSVYEETFAYAVSSSAFRRHFGGMFHRPTDSLLLLCSTLLLLLAQVSQLFVLNWLPIWPFWSAVVGIVVYLIARHLLCARRLRKAKANLGGDEHSAAVLFRCTDREIATLAACADADAARQWMQQQAQTSLRWQVISARFLSV